MDPGVFRKNVDKFGCLLYNVIPTSQLIIIYFTYFNAAPVDLIFFLTFMGGTY